MNQQIKVLTLLQPWATLVVIGAKKIETRSWRTKYRGLIAIHSSAKWKSAEDIELAHSNRHFADALNRAGYIPSDLPLGKILGVCSVDNCKLICELSNLFPPPEPEFSFGNYAPGRWGWGLSGAREFKEPVPATGSRMLWNAELDLDELGIYKGN